MNGRTISIASGVTVLLIAWISLPTLDPDQSPEVATVGLFGLVIMWAAMMLAMMAPAATPSCLLYRSLSEQPTAVVSYLTGYLGMWCLVGGVYALAHWQLQRLGLLDSTMRIEGGRIPGILLIAAGIWQWSPIKGRCVAHCRSPLGFMMTNWREGVRGALTMGGHYAMWCIGCCWLLMATLFVVGAMSIGWAALIATYILIERLFPVGRSFDRTIGVLLVLCGAWLIKSGLTIEAP